MAVFTVRSLLCPACGVVAVPTGTPRCATCGAALLDFDDPASRDAINAAIVIAEPDRTRATKIFDRIFWGTILACLVVVPVLLFQWGIHDFAGSWFLYVVLFGAMGLIGVVTFVSYRVLFRRPEGWRTASWRAMPELRAWLRHSATSTVAIASVVCLVFVAASRAAGIDALAFARGDELVRPWRIVTSAFTHAGAVHLIGNLVALLHFGLPVDARVGRPRTAIVLAVSAVTGALAQARYSPVSMIGFSGAVYGVIGAHLALMPRRKRVMSVAGVAFSIPVWAWAVLVIPLLTVLAAVDQHAGVAWVAHAVGLVVGFLVALPMRRRPAPAWLVAYEQERTQAIERNVG